MPQERLYNEDYIISKNRDSAKLTPDYFSPSLDLEDIADLKCELSHDLTVAAVNTCCKTLLS